MKDNNVFEVMIQYVGACSTTDKQELVKEFELFLDHPAHFGTFCVRWKENDDSYNNETFDDFVERVKKGKKYEAG